MWNATDYLNVIHKNTSPHDISLRPTKAESVRYLFHEYDLLNILVYGLQCFAKPVEKNEFPQSTGNNLLDILSSLEGIKALVGEALAASLLPTRGHLLYVYQR